MPELPEVETTVRGLALHLENRILTGVRIARPDMRRPFPEGLGQALVGARVTGLGRRAKFGLIHTNRDQTLIFHLGMSGRWRIDPDSPDQHDHLTIETETNRFALNDPRRFGWVDLVDTIALDSWPSFVSIGPEPLGPDLTAAYLKAALAGHADVVAFALASALVSYCWVFDPRVLAPSFRRFLDAGGGVNFFLFDGHFKAQLHYVHREELSEGYSTPNDSLILQVQALL